MTLDWQLVTAIGLVLAAAVLLARRAWSLVRSGGERGCGSCSSAGATPDRTRVKPLVMLDDTAPREREERT